MIEHDIDILARTIYGEARGEKTAGKKAVACVIMNRYKAKKWFSGKTIAETCQKPWQFSCWNKNDPNRQKIMNATAVELGECLTIAEDFVNGKEKDFLCGSCAPGLNTLAIAHHLNVRAIFLLGHLRISRPDHLADDGTELVYIGRPEKHA